jgi:1,4-dihydroxy-2-naphthoyl-CoA hydrolase
MLAQSQGLRRRNCLFVAGGNCAKVGSPERNFVASGRCGHYPIQAGPESSFVMRQLPQSIAEWNVAGAHPLPGHLGMGFLKVEPQEVLASFAARQALEAWKGYLHAGSVVALADTCCGYSTLRALPAGATGFTTIELKSNFFASARRGVIICTARPLQQGRTTQVWDAIVKPEGEARPIAQFRNTQPILWPKA